MDNNNNNNNNNSYSKLFFFFFMLIRGVTFVNFYFIGVAMILLQSKTLTRAMANSL
jgi:hypothetical protein